MHRTLACVVLLACIGGSKSDTDDTTSGGDDDDDDACPVSAADDLSDLESELSGIDHECEDLPFYVPEVPTATIWYIGSLTIDDCGEVTGTETAFLFPNPAWLANDGYECIITWDITGVLREPFNDGSYGLDMEANVDPFNSTCPEDAYGMTFYSGFEYMQLQYDVVQTGDGDITLLFAESGNELAWGEDNESHLTYITSNVDCAFF